jgi:LmbE family N-acetylglucosaminyl deacetylase
MKKKIYVVAPHPDDELIGAFSLIAEKYVDEVIYMATHNDIRMSEINKCCKEFGFIPTICVTTHNLTQVLNRITQEPNSVIFTPDPQYEYQPYHKKISGLVDGICQDWQIYYYTIEMNTPYLSEVILPERKRESLDMIYYSQKHLWTTNHKYFLFEGFRKKMYTLGDFEEAFFYE